MTFAPTLDIPFLSISMLHQQRMGTLTSHLNMQDRDLVVRMAFVEKLEKSWEKKDVRLMLEAQNAFIEERTAYWSAPENLARLKTPECRNALAKAELAHGIVHIDASEIIKIIQEGGPFDVPPFDAGAVINMVLDSSRRQPTITTDDCPCRG